MGAFLRNAVRKEVAVGHFDETVEFLSRKISSSTAHKFKPILEMEIANEREKTHARLVRFISVNQKQFEVAAVYLEMNAFDTNFKRWYFDLFAYDHCHENVEDVDWQASYRSERVRETSLQGLKKPQSVFKWYQEKGKLLADTEETHEAARFFVLVKFMQFVRDVVASGQPLAVPVLIGAPGFECVGRIDPPQEGNEEAPA